MTVTVQELRQMAERILDHIQEVHGDTLTMASDYFWWADPAQRIDLRRPPTDFTVGQVAECLDNLRMEAEDPDLTLCYSAVWLGQVLEIIGQELDG